MNARSATRPTPIVCSRLLAAAHEHRCMGAPLEKVAGQAREYAGLIAKVNRAGRSAAMACHTSRAALSVAAASAELTQFFPGQALILLAPDEISRRCESDY